MVKTLFRQPSIFLALLSERGFHYENDATIKQLRNKSALSVANRDIKLIDQVFSRDSVASIFANKPQWLVYERGDGYYQLIAAVDVLRFLQHHQQLEIELDAIPARSLSAVSIKESDNLQTAYEQIRAGFADACVILGDSGHSKIKGVLTAEDVMAFPIKA